MRSAKLRPASSQLRGCIGVSLQWISVRASEPIAKLKRNTDWGSRDSCFLSVRVPEPPTKPAAIAVLASRHFHSGSDAGRFSENNIRDSTMNIQTPYNVTESLCALEGKVSLVTGSTLRDGLGIARALAQSGSAVVLNGFGKPEDSRKRRRG